MPAPRINLGGHHVEGGQHEIGPDAKIQRLGKGFACLEAKRYGIAGTVRFFEREHSNGGKPFVGHDDIEPRRKQLVCNLKLACLNEAAGLC